MWFQYRPYVSVAQRKAQAAREVEKRRKKGQVISPVNIQGRNIANTFWGAAWCENLESYSDFSNRLPRGRTYVRNGSVVDLQIKPGKVTALVSGSELYEVTVTFETLPSPAWRSIKSRCAGQIGSLVELLQGKLSHSVIEIITAHDGGLFPKPKEIKMSCSCPDWAGMCKHVAAVLYGVGARLDHQPELFFLLRKVDHLEMIEQAVAGAGKTGTASTKKKTLAADDIADVFGIELAESATSTAVPAAAKKTAKPSRAKGGAAKPVANLDPSPSKPPAKTRRRATTRKSKHEAVKS